MGMLRIFTAAFAVALIVGCSSGQDAAAPPPPPPKTVFDPLTQDLERARGVQKTVDSAADKTRQSVDNQERGDDAR